MKLARKLTIALALGILGVMVVSAYVQVQREVELFESERRDDERLFGSTLRASVEAVWATEGDDRAVELVSRASDSLSEVQFRWVWLDDASDSHQTPLTEDRKRTLTQQGGAVRATTEERAYVYIPIRGGEGRPAALEISESLEFQQRYLRDSILQAVIATFSVTAVCGVIAMGLGVFLVGRPMRRLYEQARRIGCGDLSQRLSISQRDEVGELAREINTMCDQLVAANEHAGRETETRIAALEQLRHADRLKTVGQLASGVAHELGTPLSVVLGHARLIAKEPDVRETVVSGAHVIVEQADRMATIIRQLLDFARRRTPNFEAWNLSEIVRDTISMLAPLARKRGVDLTLATETDSTLAKVDRYQAQQVITNLAMNAIQAVAPGGRVQLEVARCASVPPGQLGDSAQDLVRVTVRDDGPGMSAETTPRVFEPFYTTKGIGEGTGLGLSVAYGIVQEHGGWIDVDTTPGRGSAFSVFFQTAPSVAGGPTS